MGLLFIRLQNGIELFVDKQTLWNRVITSYRRFGSFSKSFHHILFRSSFSTLRPKEARFAKKESMFKFYLCHTVNYLPLAMTHLLPLAAVPSRGEHNCYDGRQGELTNGAVKGIQVRNIALIL